MHWLRKWRDSFEPFHLPELAGQIDESVNQMRHFEGMVLKNLKKKNALF